MLLRHLGRIVVDYIDCNYHRCTVVDVLPGCRIVDHRSFLPVDRSFLLVDRLRIVVVGGRTIVGIGLGLVLVLGRHTIAVDSYRRHRIVGLDLDLDFVQNCSRELLARDS